MIKHTSTNFESMGVPYLDLTLNSSSIYSVGSICLNILKSSIVSWVANSTLFKCSKCTWLSLSSSYKCIKTVCYNENIVRQGKLKNLIYFSIYIFEKNLLKIIV